MPEFSPWDLALLLTVSVMGTAVAYLRKPEQKAFVLMLPVPFTMAMIAVGRPLDATNVLGLCLLVIYSLAVWALHVKWKVPIVIAIVASAALYSLLGWRIERALPPNSGKAFWLSLAFALAFSLVAPRWFPRRDEPHHRSPLPLWLKFPAILGVVAVVILMKRQLGGFVTAFPMVGVITSYEARFSLWTIVRRMPTLILAMVPMHVVIRLTQDRLGVGPAVALAWPVYLLSLALVLRWYHGRLSAAAPDVPEEDDENEATEVAPNIDAPVARQSIDA